jgi:3',5'-cyclic AMP phosphodiesterase CpdA
MKFIHLTDTHLVTPGDKLHNLDPAERLSRCLDDIRRHHGDAECCVITGDLADRGEDSAYQFLSAQISRLGMKCHLLLGNHDHRENYLRCFADTTVDDHGFVQYTVQTSAGVFVAIDTFDYGTNGGIYCDQRREWLQATLESNRDKPVFLFMHHPPFDLNFPCIDNIGLSEQQAFAEIVRPYGNIRHLFLGHAHRPISGNWLGISFSSLGGTNHQIDLDFNSERIHYNADPPVYSIVFIADDRVVVHTHAYPL